MWSRVPLLRMIIPYILGVLLAENYSHATILPLYELILSAICVVMGALLFGILFTYSTRWIYGIFIMVFLVSAGYFMTQKSFMDEQLKLDAISSDSCIYIASVSEAFKERERSYRTQVKIKAVNIDSCWHPLVATVLVYARKDSSFREVQAGDLVLIHASLQPVRPPANPAEFNYKQYLARSGIYHSTFVDVDHWHFCERDEGTTLLQYAGGIRTKLLEKLAAHGLHDRRYAVSAALLLGDDSLLGDEIREAYAGAGAMHILCVSGLHVGVIYLVLTTLFGFLNRSRIGSILLPFLLISSIWSYALITGLAPPVTRAAAMISFIIIGNTFSRQRNVYNTLAAAAFLMLLLNPQVLFGAGFQLSYTAVLGIVSLQKPLNDMFYFKNIIPDKIWAMTTVSIAAQIGTLPIILYYFHQFPLYSLLTNLVVIPLSSLIIYCGILLFILPSLSQLAYAVAWMLDVLIQLMDMGVNFIEKLPWAVVTDVSITLSMTLILYCIIVLMMLFFLQKKPTFLFVGMIAILLLSTHRLHENYFLEKQSSLIVYAVRGHSAYDIISGRSHTFYADSALLSDPGKINYSIKPNWLERGLDEPVIHVLNQEGQKAKGKWEMAYVTGNRTQVTDHRQQDPGFLILRGSGPYTLEDLLNSFKPSLVIIDSSVPRWKVKQLKAERCSVEIWDVGEEGAYKSD